MEAVTAAAQPRNITSYSRRVLLRLGLATGLLAYLRPAARAQLRTFPETWPETAFAEQSLAAALAMLFAGESMQESSAIEIDMVDLAEDGAVIPVRIGVAMAGVESLALFAEKNPVPLLALFDLSQAVEPQLAVRIKMAESAHVIAVVRAAGRLYTARRYIQVAHGGCY